MMHSRYPVAGILAVIIILLLEVVFLSVSEPMTGLPVFQPTADDAVVVAKRSLFEMSGNKVAIVGDSSSMHGLSPEIMAKRSGLEFFNYGTLASLTAVGYCEMAIELLRKKDKPKALLFSILPQTLEIDDARAREMGQLSRYLVAHNIDGGEIYSVSIRERWDWLVKKHRFNIFPPEFGGSFGAFNQLVSNGKGYIVESKNSVRHTAVLDRFQPSRMSFQALDKMFGVAAETKVPVVFILNPKPSTLISNTYLSDARDFLADLKQKYPDVLILQKDAPVWEEAYFGTETHLNAKGADKYSQMIAAELGLMLLN
jgi:hypothetical protein